MVAGTIQQDKGTSNPADTQTQGNLQPQALHWRPPTSNPRQTKPQKPPRTQAADPSTMLPGNSPQEQTQTNGCSCSLPNPPPPRAHNKRASHPSLREASTAPLIPDHQPREPMPTTANHPKPRHPQKQSMPLPHKNHPPSPR